MARKLINARMLRQTKELTESKTGMQRTWLGWYVRPLQRVQDRIAELGGASGNLNGMIYFGLAFPCMHLQVRRSERLSGLADVACCNVRRLLDH